MAQKSLWPTAADVNSAAHECSGRGSEQLWKKDFN
jgi:hypothetical protein